MTDLNTTSFPTPFNNRRLASSGYPSQEEDDSDFLATNPGIHFPNSTENPSPCHGPPATDVWRFNQLNRGAPQAAMTPEDDFATTRRTPSPFYYPDTITTWVEKQWEQQSSQLAAVPNTDYAAEVVHSLYCGHGGGDFDPFYQEGVEIPTAPMTGSLIDTSPLLATDTPPDFQFEGNDSPPTSSTPALTIPTPQDFRVERAGSPSLVLGEVPKIYTVDPRNLQISGGNALGDVASWPDFLFDPYIPSYTLDKSSLQQSRPQPVADAGFADFTHCTPSFPDTNWSHGVSAESYQPSPYGGEIMGHGQDVDGRDQIPYFTTLEGPFPEAPLEYPDIQPQPYPPTQGVDDLGIHHVTQPIVQPLQDEMAEVGYDQDDLLQPAENRTSDLPNGKRIYTWKEVIEQRTYKYHTTPANQPPDTIPAATPQPASEASEQIQTAHEVRNPLHGWTTTQYMTNIDSHGSVTSTSQQSSPNFSEKSQTESPAETSATPSDIDCQRAGSIGPSRRGGSEKKRERRERGAPLIKKERSKQQRAEENDELTKLNDELPEELRGKTRVEKIRNARWTIRQQTETIERLTKENEALRSQVGR
ncbi:hypothetical protein JAAARDRAFT_54155 [Jaapia argillacea MUCL 33604]|uniref:Uncharacterized protein n=1 Tax=Jaapia argillacea MUCL 33604 TaxID=933084 RepID=A0A067Q7H3_9AGAM|nr:hypothetical protein JAAARDRAFT_54155 [Jaapia argillacea MUCL 33604]